MNLFFYSRKKANFIQFEIWLSTQCDVRLEADFFYSQPIPLTPGTENILWNNIKLIFCSSPIRSVIIGVEYRNCCQNLDVYLLFAILLGQIYWKLNHRLVTYKLASP